MNQTFVSEQPLIGKISIFQVEGKVVDSKLTSIAIIEITTRSLLFSSSLKFPLSESVIYQLKTSIAKNEIELYGTIVKSISQTGNDVHHYQFKFLMSSDQFLPFLNDDEIPRLFKQKNKYVNTEESIR
ncbi:hypothetical protein [Halalkalibacter akibai]|uniref:Uncharacterized protein n=1 Tax=Halalkalibacter akibai (strain ATCC 43226 / DSM 21942 / CIP 109018 / JCM 9157 / 1139) TaxID=1236973 RepID=W4QRG4_HALA3|nr:hypothetical protein [Halalkalibacter akibai]GAE34507.1 hypothetical protein JCM9157_1568 [Halalkalibacter akibai JCM 9157]